MKAPLPSPSRARTLLYTAHTVRSLGFVSTESLPLPARIMIYCCHLRVSSLYISLSPGFESSHGLNHPLTLSPHCCLTGTPAVCAFRSEDRLDTSAVSVFVVAGAPTLPSKSHTLAVCIILDFSAQV